MPGSLIEGLVRLVADGQDIAFRILEPGSVELAHRRYAIDGLEPGHIVFLEHDAMPPHILHLGFHIVCGEGEQGIGRLAGIGRGVEQKAGAAADLIHAPHIVFHCRGEAELVAIPGFCARHVCSWDGRVGTMICEHNFLPF